MRQPPRLSSFKVSRLLWCTETCESLLLARVCTRSMLGSCAHLSRRVPYMCNTGGVVDTKVGFFGVKSTNVPLGADGTKPARVAHRPLWPTKAAKPGLFPETEDLFAERSSLRGRTKVARKLGLPGLGQGVKSAKVPPTPYFMSTKVPPGDVQVKSETGYRRNIYCVGRLTLWQDSE